MARLGPHSRCQTLQKLLPSARAPEATERLRRKAGEMGSVFPASWGRAHKESARWDSLMSLGTQYRRGFLLVPGLCLEPCYLARKRTRFDLRLQPRAENLAARQKPGEERPRGSWKA